ncbi:unnamed protein product [Polarella glacialis]|uniref:Uncharacterized protein n=1 Tax=Polarella glacialis TaxID=89957 RepID=A0A813G9A7_POLGL|nr:unnamed protein product [Polarella glacialis]
MGKVPAHDGSWFAAAAAQGVGVIHEPEAQNSSNAVQELATPLARDEALLKCIEGLWGFAKLRLSTAEIELFAEQGLARIQDLDARAPSNTGWGCAKLELEGPQVMAWPASAAPRKSAGCDSQGLGNVARKLAAAVFKSQALMEATASESHATAASPNPQNLANISWSFGRASIASQLPSSAVCREAHQRMSGRIPQNLTNLGQPPATCLAKGKLLLGAAPARSTQVAQECSPQDSSNRARSSGNCGLIG